MDSTHPVNPLAGPRLWNRAAPGYLREVADGLALFAADALRLAGVRPGMRIADVACGPGSLSFAAVRAGARASALDFSAEMVALLEECARRDGIAEVEARVGDGMALPWPDAQFDAAFSMFGLIFFPDRARGLAELRRVLRPGGRAVVASWVPADRVPIMADIWAVLGSELPGGPYTRVRPALGDPETFRAELGAAGFGPVEVHELRHDLEVSSVLDYWRSLERSTPPLLAIQESVPAARWAELSAAIARRLEERFGTGPVRVPLVALLGAGTRPAG
jgi:SAM-dependent methyltransferase